MADDDLLLTNNYTQNTSNTNSSKQVFSKLMNSKNTSEEVYDKDSPNFTKNFKPTESIGTGISENSVAFEQFLKIAETDKKKKVKKTVMNIDSRNRTKTYTFDSLNVKYTGDSPLSFVTNTSFFELSIDSNTNTNDVNYIDNTKFFNQLILGNLNVNEFSKLGITKDSFEFSVTSGAPIFDIIQFIYDEYDNQGKLTSEYNSFDNSKQKYRYNRLVLNLPSNIEPKELQTMRLGKDADINIITNVNISYPTPSHYFINLGRTFSSVYSVKLISSEIPNTSYTFNENLIESNFGQFKLSTKQNNKLRWINKTDRVSVATNSLHMATLFHENMPVLPSVQASKLHDDHFKKIVNLYNCNLNDNSIKASTISNINLDISITTIDNVTISVNDYFIVKDQLNTQENGLYKKNSSGVEKISTNDFIESNNISFIFFVSNGDTNKGKYFLINKDNELFSFKEVDYVENLRRLHSLIRVSQDIKTVSIPLKSRDYYFNNRYLGNFVTNNNKIIGVNQNTTSNISDTVFTSNESLISSISNDLSSFFIYKAVINKSVHPNNNTYSHITFNKYSQFNLEFYSANTQSHVDDYTETTLTNLELPFKIVFQNRYKGSSDNSFLTYIFNVTKITEITPPTIGDPAYDARLIKKYTFDIIPINSNVVNGSSPFHNITNGDIQFTIYNSISSKTIFNYQKYYPDIWDKLQSYYIKNELGLIKSEPQLSNHDVQLSFTAIDKASVDIPIPEVTQGTPSPHNMKYLLEFKTYYSYNFINTVLNKQVETVQVGGVNGGYYLFLFFQDANANSVSEISNVAKEYTYVKVNNNFYKLGSDITYNITTKKFKIQIIPVDDDISKIDKISDVTTNVTVSFQRLDYKELKYVYIKSADFHQDISNRIVRFNLKDTEDYNFIEYYFSGKVETTIVTDTQTDESFNVHKYEVRYKFKPELSTIDLLDYKKKGLTLFDENNRTYMRNYIGNYIVTKYNNNNTDTTNSLIMSDQIEVAYSFSNDEIDYKDSQSNINFLEYFEDNIFTKKLETDIIDIPSYQIIAITNKSIEDGISSISFAKEFIETEEQSAILMNPKINSDTNKLPSQLNMSLNNNSYKAIDNGIATKYPVYELNIASGKYSADSIVKYMLGALDNLKSRVYDYSKGIFFNDSSFQKFIDLNNEFGINQESKFVISVDKSVNSISFKQYKKIFDSHKNTSVIKGQIAYYNEGFPFVYFNIPQISLPNNSLVYMSGGGSLGNMGGGVTRGESNVVVPLNFRIRIRQLLPLPKIDSINNNANLFAKEGYVDVEDNQIYNKFVDYINNAVKSDNVKDISSDYIVNQIFGFNESGYIDLNNLSEDKLTNLKEEFTSKGIPKNGANITESELNKSFVDNYGKNTKYKTVNNFNNQSENAFSYNRTGLEYYGQALINGYNNEQPYKEYFQQDDEVEDYETYGDELSSGFETTFIQNELFMRLADTNVTNKKNIIGRFTKVSEHSDKYGNIVADYDLFSDNYLNFKIGDIIIGLDSNTIGIILPYDYKYNSLPNNDLVALGAGAYLMNKSVLDAGSAFEKYVSVTNSSKGTRDLAKKFVSNINNWQIERNKTNRGFYVYSSTTPNASKLAGTKLPNFQLYVPRFFKFLEDTDTALDKFGLKNTENNNKFNYFKTNYESNHEVSIKRSFFNIAKNNEIFTDYLIFETKSTDNFSVNDRVYIEDHSIISKGGDFKREKFFNVELLENYASFISKLETIYNNSVQNYNGLSGIGNTLSDDSTYLYDNEYKYDDASGNSTARGTVELEANITSFIINDAGRGYTGSPSITIDKTFETTEANATFTVLNGKIDSVTVNGDGGKYSSIPNIIVENPSITASVTANVIGLGEIGSVTVSTDSNLKGFGYTESPIVTAPASDGIRATAIVTISGIGLVTINNSDLDNWVEGTVTNANSIKANLLQELTTIPENGRFDIIFSTPATGVAADAAEGYIEYTNDSSNVTVSNVVVTKSGSKYSPTETINISRVQTWNTENNGAITTKDAIINTDNAQFSVIVNAIGELTMGTQGTKYYVNSSYSGLENAIQNGNIFIDHNNTNSTDTVKSEGNPIITLTDTSGTGSGAIIKPILTEGTVSSLHIVHGGSGYSNSTTITIEVPRALFRSTIDNDGRLSTVTPIYSPIGYSSTVALTISSPKETAIGSINDSKAIIISNKGKGYISGGDNPAIISGYSDTIGNTITTNISDGKIQRIELELNNYNFAVGESPLIVIPNSAGDDFLTLSIFRASRGYINMKRNYANSINLDSLSGVGLDIKNANSSSISNIDFNKALGYLNGPETDIVNNIYDIYINTDDSDWDTFKFTSAPEIYVYKMTYSADSSAFNPNDLKPLKAAANINEPVEANNNRASVINNEAVTVKAIIENGTILSCVPDVISNVTSDAVVIFNSPIQQGALSAEIQGTVKSISIDNSGNNYDKDNLPSIDIDLPNITAEAISIVDSGGTITRIDITNPGAGYSSSTLPVITVASPTTGTNATAKANVVNGNIISISIEIAGSGYTRNNPPSVTIEAPPSGGLTKAEATSSIDNGRITTLTVTNIGAGYTNIPKLKVDDPPTIAKLPIPFKNKQIYRYFNQDIINFNKNYYLTYKTSQSQLVAGEFNISLSDKKIINQLYIETAFDFIKTDLSIGDIRNNMCVITITDDSNEKMTFTRSDIKNNFTSPSSIPDEFFSNNSKYHLNIKAYRLPIAVSETANFGDKSSDGSHKTQYISKYSTLGIFQRLLDEQINNIYNNMNYNIIKAAELYRTYSYNIFKNRIIKIKVCPIDEQGFSFENCNSTGTVAQETLVSNRQVKGYSKKLFPYHEYDVIKSYDKSEFGRDVNIIGTAYKGFRRPQQHFNNKETTSKAFLPGMGVYVINNESITNGTQINNTHYNSTATAKNIDLYYSEYQYETQFMGYVLGTSVNSRQEYNRNYRMHSDNFSKLDASDSVHSEYYIYMLIDPDATSTEQMNELFNTLNADNVNIVFDANARTDYTDTPLTQPGYVTSRNEFYINSSKNDHKTKSDDKQYSIPKNIYKQRCFMNEQNVLKFFEDETYDTEITTANVDAFLGLTAPSITINKPKLNKTLPYYNFQTRLACATIVTRPVAYEKKNDTYSRKLFNSGDYDYFYKHYLENKTVMRYKAMQETRNIDNMNKHNMVVENPTNRNFKANNFKETDCHSSCLDPNINNTEDFFDVGNINNVTEVPEGNKQILKFNNGEDIILVDAYKRKFSYESGDVDYSDIQGRGDQKLGIQHTHIKILTASIIPPLFFNHNRLLDNKLNEYCNHVSILDHQYDSGIERLTYNNIVGKYKPDKIHIVGDNSNQYSGTDVDDMAIYNKVFVTDTSVSNQIIISNTIGIASTIDSNNISKLTDCILLLNTNIKCKNESQPIDDTNNTEMVLINSAELLTGTDEVKLTLKNDLGKVHKTNIEEETGRSFIPYSSVKTSSALVYNNSSSSYSFEVSSSENHYSTLKEDDYILIDWGVQRDVIHSGTIPYKLATNNSPNKTSLYTTATYKITKITEDNSVNPHTKTVTIQNPRVLYPSGIRIIIMKNPLNDENNSTISNNFLSTQPFTINSEWYTRIFYKGASYNIGSHFDGSYKKNNVLPNLDDNYIRGGTPLFNKNYSNTIYIGGMKGIKLPFLDVNGSITSTDTYSIPPEDDFYEITPSLRDDFMTENNSSPVINNIQGEFTTRFNNINNISDFDNNPDINSINEAQWIDNKEPGTEYASIVIKGLYLGYGGFMEDRANQDTINTIINKSSGTAIKKIKQINNKFYIYIQLSKTYNNFFLASNLDESYNLINQSTRKTYLDYETNLHLLDEILETQPEDYEPYLSIFGKNGKMVRKIIKTPYDLNPNNYIYMVIPNLNHIKSVQNNEIEDAFAKILLPGESNKTLFSSFVAGTKIFYNNLFNNLNELEITFITNEGHLFDFNGSEHSFAIEITEIIDKLEYINPRFGNIEF